MGPTPPDDPQTGASPPADGPNTPKRGTAAQQRVSGAVRARQALDLYASGLSYGRIADTLGYADKSGAKKAVDRALAWDREHGAKTAAEWRDRISLRLERLYETAAVAGLRGDPKMLAAAARILDQQARLQGANMPATVHVTGKMDEEIEALLAELGVQELPTTTEERTHP